MPPATETLFTVTDGNQKQVFRDFCGSQLVLTGFRSSTISATNTPCSRLQKAARRPDSRP